MNEHVHSWQTFRLDKVVCNGCNTVSDIPTILDQAANKAAREARIQLISSQLYARELKKDAHTKYYNEVILTVSLESLMGPEKPAQGTLL